MPTANPTPSKTPIPPTVASFKGLDDWIEVFRAGTHVDMKGKQHSFSTADLDQMAANQALAAAPAVLGHPEHDDPAYAWTEGIKREGDSLFVKFTDIDPDFAAAVTKGSYRNRSVSVYQDKANGWRVRHVGWLGAAKPAVDGLKPVQFASGDDVEVIEFMAAEDSVRSLIWATDSVATMFRGFREYLLETAGADVADRVVPNYAIESLTGTVARARAALDAQPDDDSLAYVAPTQTTGADMTPEELAKIKADAQAEAELKFASQGKDLAELRAERKAERITTQINEWTAAGKVTPAEAGGLAEFMGALEDEPTEFSFAAPGSATPLKKTPKDWFANFMAGRKAVVKLGGRTEMDIEPEGGLSNDPTEISQKAAAFISEQAGKGITVALPDAIEKFTPKAAA